MRKVLSFFALAVVVLVAPTNVAAATKSVSIGDDFFSPAAVTLVPGDSVKWTNADDRLHSATRTSFVYPWGQTSSLSPGATFTKAFTAAGTYTYFCRFHTDMRGTVRVSMTASPTSGTTATYFTLRWASVTAASGHRYVIQKRNPGSTTYATWRTTTAPSGTFRSSTLKGTFYFRAILQRFNSSTGAWVSGSASPLRSITVA